MSGKARTNPHFAALGLTDGLSSDIPASRQNRHNDRAMAILCTVSTQKNACLSVQQRGLKSWGVHFSGFATRKVFLMSTNNYLFVQRRHIFRECAYCLSDYGNKVHLSIYKQQENNNACTQSIAMFISAVQVDEHKSLNCNPVLNGCFFDEVPFCCFALHVQVQQWTTVSSNSSAAAQVLEKNKWIILH